MQVFFSGIYVAFSFRRSFWTIVCLVASAAGTSSLMAQAPQAETLAKTTQLRDAFVEKVHAAGFTCPIAPPKIVVEDIPSFGQYDDETNILHTSDWSLLKPEEKAFFMKLIGPNATDQSAHEAFEKAAHGWIFSHEMGHWWQACRGFIASHSHYQVEYGANRIALAYWREADPSIAALMMTLFHTVLDHQPSPVPAGQDMEKYFNDNYEALGPTPAYPWFQSRMGVTLEEEKPAPVLKDVLAGVKK